MILKVGTILLMSASLVMLTLGCEKQTDEVVKKDPVSQTDSKTDFNPVSNPDDANYREVSINVTGLT